MAGLTEGFAFVSADKVPAREGVNGQLSAYREAQAAERRQAGEQVAKGLLAGKALTDNETYEEHIGAIRVSSRVKALVNPVLREQGFRASVRVVGNETDGFRWFVQAVAVEADEAE